MKIHDKYVIELKEVIRGYGSDPMSHSPLPCDYKFYEIDGVAICEESFKKMTPLNDLVLKALEDVKAEIAEYGSIWVEYTIKGHTDRDIQKTIEDVIKQAKTQVLETIDRKIAEVTKNE